MKITLQFLLLCLLVLLLTGCPEPELIIDYVYGISVKLDIMNNSTQEQNITFHGVQHSYADPGTWGMSFDDTGKEVHEVSSTVQGGDTATLDGKSPIIAYAKSSAPAPAKIIDSKAIPKYSS